MVYTTSANLKQTICVCDDSFTRMLASYACSSVGCIQTTASETSYQDVSSHFYFLGNLYSYGPQRLSPKALSPPSLTQYHTQLTS